MGIFSKKDRFYIKQIVKEEVPLEEIIAPALTGPKWFSNLCPFVRKKKRAIDLHPFPINKTARGCPGMLELFKNSFLIKFGCDILLETNTKGEYFWQKPSGTQVLKLHHHPQEQVESQPPLSSFIMIKFCLPFIFQVPDNKVSFIDPVYWKNQPYKIAPGILNFRNDRHAVPLHIITLFEKKNAVYEFKRGDPMVLLYTLNKSTLEVNKDLDGSFARGNLEKSFSNRWQPRD